MRNICACIRPSKEALPSPPGGSSESGLHVTAPAASGSERAATSSPPLPPAGAERTVGMVESEKRSVVEKRIESSKAHWSLLSKPDTSLDEEEAEEEVEMSKEEEEFVTASNEQVFETLQSHPLWGQFFRTFGYTLGVAGRGSDGSLQMGEKFAEGGQAELFHAYVTWRDLQQNEEDRKDGTEWVLKVFKKGTLLQDLQAQWPHGMLRNYAEENKRTLLEKRAPLKYYCDVFYGTLLGNGRFAFLMVREQEDLRTLIDRNMLTATEGPFQSRDVQYIMYNIAKGMDWLHSLDIVHRDLKASNVLSTRKHERNLWTIGVADFECSIGVVGTGFFRAPEILQACKDRNLYQTPNLFTKASDIYSYGMTCFEILTGKLPFEGHPKNEYDFVINGQRPEVPEYVEGWAQELLNWCWQSNPANRPSIKEVLDFLVANLELVRSAEERAKSMTMKEEQEWIESLGGKSNEPTT